MVTTIAGLGTHLVDGRLRSAARLTWEAVSVPHRVARTIATTSVATARATAEALGDVAEGLAVADRRVWTVGGQAHLEVHGLERDDAGTIAAAVEETLSALEGVTGARVDARTRRVSVDFDPDRVTLPGLLDALSDVEPGPGPGAVDASAPEGLSADAAAPAEHPGSDGPVTQQAIALAAEATALAAAVAGRALRLPSLPGSATALIALVDHQPRLRRLLEARFGPATTDLLLAVSSAAVNGMTQGAATLAVDTTHRAQTLVAARARRSAFRNRAADLLGPGRPVRTEPLRAGERPVPMPSGPVERLLDRAATGSLLAAGGILAGTRNADLAGRAILVAVPRAARQGRESFANTLSVVLAQHGVQVLAPAALRRLDRVTTVVVDSTLLHDERPLVVDARALADHWTSQHVWSAAQRLLDAHSHLPVPPPPGRERDRLALLEEGRDATAGGPPAELLARVLLTEDGRPVGEVRIGREVDPLADAVLSSVRAAGARLLLTADPHPGLANRADRVLRTADGELTAQIRRSQADGEVVVVVSPDEDALAAADLGIGIVPAEGRVPWAADILCGPGLGEVPRILQAVPAARSISERGVRLSVAASFLSGLLLAVGTRGRGRRATLPVALAAGSALVSGTLAGARIGRLSAPVPVLHTPWHALEPDEVLVRLPRPAVHEAPVTPAGHRRVPHPLRAVRTLAGTVRAELADPLTPVLATGAGASAVIGSPTDAVLVGGVLLANAVVSGAQRLRADRALRDLLLDQRLPARVLVPGPDGAAAGPRELRRVPAAQLQPGHVIELRAGDVVPADTRLLEEQDLEVDEASLTGESAVVEKQVGATPGAELGDRACMLYESTTVVAGSARAVVVAVGEATEAGRALALAGRAGAPVGMQARLEELTRRGLPITLLGGAGVTGLGLLRGRGLRDALSSGIGIAVAAVPEGLPLVATVAQLGAARRLSQRGVLTRSSRTVEALGRVDTICFDKTGTLTEGRLRLARVAGLDGQWEPESPQAQRILRAAAQASPPPGNGQPVVHATDQAVLDAAAAVLGDELTEGWRELVEVPFQSDRGFSAAVGETARRKLRLVVKGAPEVLLPRCTHHRDDTGKHALDAAAQDRAAETVAALARQGLRVLAVARRNVGDAIEEGTDPADLGDLTLLGFVGLADIPRPGARDTVMKLHRAGLETIMITGDHPVTARAIADQLGIPSGDPVTGPELANLDQAARDHRAAGASVFARVSPEQKLQIIGALQRSGRVVAMTGDGANDAAAIRLADVGIGMSAKGSTSARTAADLVLVEPDVRLLVDALVEGRAMWRRVRNAVAVLLGGNAGEVLFTLVGTAAAGGAPLGTRQFLLVNMLTDLLPSMALALAPTPTDDDERATLLRSGVPSLGAPLVRDIGVRGVSTAAGAFAAWQIGRFTGTPRRASTIGLVALVGTQLGQTLLVGGRDPLVLATGLGSAAVLAGIIQVPGVSQFFGCTPLDPLAWATALCCATGATVLSAAGPGVLHRLTTPA